MLKKPKHHGDMDASQHNEFSMCLFATYLAFHELAPSTITNYVSLAKTNLSIGLGFALTTKELELRLPRLLKGIRRMHKRTRKKRLGWRARYERMLHNKHGSERGHVRQLARVPPPYARPAAGRRPPRAAARASVRACSAPIGARSS